MVEGWKMKAILLLESSSKMELRDGLMK